jgi:hypothetical protein
VGTSYIVGILIGVPLGIISAYKQYSVIDQGATFFSMVGFSIPTFFTGTMAIIIFSVWTPTDAWWWLPSSYDTTHEIDDWDSFVFQLQQMVMPMMVLGLYNAAQISRYMRASMLDNLQQDYVRTARAKGMGEARGPSPRAAELAHPRGHRHRAERAGRLRRRAHHRAGLPRQRHRLSADPGDPGRGCAHWCRPSASSSRCLS